jgi:cytochrome c oxidase subunit 2
VFIVIRQLKGKSGDHVSKPGTCSNVARIALRAVCVTLLSLFAMVPAIRPQGLRRIEVTAKRFSFEPAEITVKKGQAVDLVLTSKDVPHGLRIRELKIELHANKGKTAEVTFTPQTVGTFAGHCSVFCGSGHGEMTLIIHVVS